MGYYVNSSFAFSGFASQPMVNATMYSQDQDIRVAGYFDLTTTVALAYFSSTAAADLQTKTVFWIIIGTAS